MVAFQAISKAVSDCGTVLSSLWSLGCHHARHVWRMHYRESLRTLLGSNAGNYWGLRVEVQGWEVLHRSLGSVMNSVYL
jgi:hypothetical protein